MPSIDRDRLCGALIHDCRVAWEVVLHSRSTTSKRKIQIGFDRALLTNGGGGPSATTPIDSDPTPPAVHLCSWEDHAPRRADMQSLRAHGKRDGRDDGSMPRIPWVLAQCTICQRRRPTGDHPTRAPWPGSAAAPARCVGASRGRKRVGRAR